MARDFLRRSLWSGLGPIERLIFGAVVISVISLAGLRPPIIFGVTIVWPFAALWGAVGWGQAGLAIRPLMLLIIFGIFHDVAANAPLGCFVLIYLVTYGLSAAAASTFDFLEQPILHAITSLILMFFAFFLLWIIASSFTNFPVRIWPLFVRFLMTTITYILLARIFDLGQNARSQRRVL